MKPAKANPETAPGLIGPAADIATRLARHTRSLKTRPGARLRQLFHGPPGTGKTTIANTVAALLADHSIDIESINGRNLTIEVVRDWQRAIAYGSLFGGWKVKIINEVDLVPQLAQDLMLTFLDDLPAQNAVLATSNATMETLTDRFATRFGAVKVTPPSADAIAAILRSVHRLERSHAAMIAETCLGNVRDALLQAEQYAILGDHVSRPKRAELKVICSAKSEQAKRAWQTMRANGKAVAA